MKTITAIILLTFLGFSVTNTLQLKKQLETSPKQNSEDHQPSTINHKTSTINQTASFKALKFFGTEKEPPKEKPKEEKPKVDPNTPPTLELLGLIESQNIPKAIVRVTPADPEDKAFTIRLTTDAGQKNFTLKSIDLKAQHVNIQTVVNKKEHTFQLQLFTRKKKQDEN